MLLGKFQKNYKGSYQRGKRCTKQSVEVPKIYSKYLRATDEVHGEDNWNWLQRLKLKKESWGPLRQHKTSLTSN